MKIHKEIVEWWPFGEGLAKGSAEIRNNMHGPESHNYASWEKYVVILVMNTTEIWRIWRK